MLRLFKSTFIVYFVLASAGIIGIVFLNPLVVMEKEIFTLIVNLCLSIPLALIWIFIVTFIFELVAAKKVNKIALIMSEECRVKDFIICYTDLLRKSSVKTTQAVLLLSLSSGYLNFGDSCSAKKVLDTIIDFPDSCIGALHKVIYYNNLIIYDIQINDLENATQHIENFRIALDNPKLNKKHRESCYRFYNDNKFLLNIEKGIYDGAEDVFKLAFEREKQKLGKVFSKYTLGRIYLHYNDFEKATESFEFVKNNGGDSHFVAEANDYLNNINQTK